MQPRSVFRLEVALTTLLGGMALLTLIWRDWVEAVFGFNPDQHNGSFEWIIVAVLAVGTVSSACLARRQLRLLTANS